MNTQTQQSACPVMQFCVQQATGAQPHQPNPERFESRQVICRGEDAQSQESQE